MDPNFSIIKGVDCTTEIARCIGCEVTEILTQRSTEEASFV